MVKKILSLSFALIFAIGVIPFMKTSSSAAKYCYNAKAALSYASKTWNNGIGLCADYVAACLNAGGVNVEGGSVRDLYNALNGTYGKAYKLSLTNSTKGKVSMAANSGKLSAGDPVFYYCNYCKDFEHVVLCNGANSDGYAKDYAHNKAHNGQKTTYTYVCENCWKESWTFYSVRMYPAEKLYGPKTDVGVPRVTSLFNGYNGIVVNWGAIEGADKYRVYRRINAEPWEKLGETTKTTFVDQTVEDTANYTYTIRAVDNGVISQHNSGKKIKCIGIVKLNSIRSYTGAVRIGWDKLPDANSYVIFRKEPGQYWRQIGRVNSSLLRYFDFTAESGKVYQYTVRAVVGKTMGCYNYYGLKTLFIKAPTAVETEIAKDGVLISYPQIAAAENYAIYRKTADTTWKRITTIDSGDITSFIDTSVENGNTYCYTVRAIKGKYYSSYNGFGSICEYVNPNHIETTETTEPVPTEPATEAVSTAQADVTTAVAKQIESITI